MEAIESCLARGQGAMAVQSLDDERVWRYSNSLHCPDSGRRYRAPQPAMFSFNSPAGACEHCRGFGRVIGVDWGLVIPDDKKGTFDAVLSFRNLHGWQNRNVLDKNLTAVFEALKPGGYLGVEAHRAKPGADPKESGKKGYLPEAYVIERAEAAGFKLDAKSEINANPKDTTDHPEGVWTLPPTLRLGDKDKEKYLAIGESDRMTLRFIKPKTAAKAPAPAKKP